jgi:multiple sugar transport system ATP-binding protein
MFVANFVGDREIVFVDVTARYTDGRLDFQSERLAVTVPGAGPGYARVGGRSVKLGIRAEGVRLADPQSGEGVRAVVTLVEPAGPDIIVFAETEAGLELCCRADAGTRIARGEAVRLTLAPERLQVFDPDSGVAFPVHA